MGRLPGELLPKLGWLSIICSRKSSPIVGLLYYTIIIIDVSLFDRKIIVNSFISYLLYWVATSHGQLFVFDHLTTGSSKYSVVVQVEAVQVHLRSKFQVFVFI